MVFRSHIQFARALQPLLSGSQHCWLGIRLANKRGLVRLGRRIDWHSARTRLTLKLQFAGKGSGGRPCESAAVPPL